MVDGKDGPQTVADHPYLMRHLTMMTASENATQKSITHRTPRYTTKASCGHRLVCMGNLQAGALENIAHLVHPQTRL